MSLFFRRINVFGRHPFIRLQQVLDNPAYFFHFLKKNLIYKRQHIDYTPRYKAFKFISAQESLEDLIKNGKSLARFSDGEFELVVGAGIYPPDSDWCQKWSPNLRKDLIAALSSTDPRLLVAVAPPTTFLASRESIHSIPFEYNMWVDMRRLLWKHLSPDTTYGHSHMFIQANCPDLDWNQMRSFFQKKNIVIATGNVQKLASLKLGQRNFFIECGTENAYERKEKIKESIRELFRQENLSKTETLVLLSLGPTAGIIAHQMLDDGICIWDTGHIFRFATQDFMRPSAD